MKLIALPPRSAAQPLYRAIYEQLRTRILDGSLPYGDRLPGRRRLAADLGVSVNTVSTAYEMLAAEGYLTAKARSGFIVCARAAPISAPDAPALCPDEPTPVQWQYQMTTSAIDTALFPFKTWRRLQQTVVSQNPTLLNYGDRKGDVELRRAITAHLREFRAVNCTPQQIIIGAGMEHLLGMLSQLLSHCIFAVENPGYPRTAAVLKNNSVSLCPICVDEHGMRADLLTQSQAHVACVTPSHQFPTGVIMPAFRRSELLQWACAAPDRYLIEDDYDSEFRFDTNPLPSLQGMDCAERVIYAGTFSKSLAPAFRIAYLVLPAHLLSLWQERFGTYACTVSRFEQHTLALMMERGQFAAHLRRLRIAYRKRRDLFVNAMQHRMPSVALSGTHTGLHLLASLPLHCCIQSAIQTAAQHGILCTALNSYYLTPPDHTDNRILLGYGGIHESAIEHAVHTLFTAWRPLLDGKPASDQH